MAMSHENVSPAPVVHSLNHSPLILHDSTGLVVVTVDDLRADPCRLNQLSTAAGRIQRHLWDREVWSVDRFMLHTILTGLARAGVPGIRFILDKDSLRGLRIRETYPELEANPAAISVVPGSTDAARAIVFGTELDVSAIASGIRAQRLRATDYRNEQNVGYLRPAWRQARDRSNQ